MAATAPVLDRAVLALCERVDVAPDRMRAALVEFLRRAEEGGLSPGSMRAHLEPNAAAPGRSRRA